MVVKFAARATICFEAVSDSVFFALLGESNTGEGGMDADDCIFLPCVAEISHFCGRLVCGVARREAKKHPCKKMK